MMQQSLRQGRQSRIAPIVEILAACQELGDRLDVDIIADVLEQAEAELAEMAEQIPASARVLTPEQGRIGFTFMVLGQLLMDATEFAEQQSPDRELRRQLRDLSRRYVDIITRRVLAKAPESVRVSLFAEASAWGAVFMSYVQREKLAQLLRDVARGGTVRKAMRQDAAEVLAWLVGEGGQEAGAS
jgi:hypothetical protein